MSDGEGDEAAGALARAEMELKEDRERDRAIITAVTEGHEAMRKMSRKGKYSFEKLVGDSSSGKHRGKKTGKDGETAEGAEEEEEYDEEEMLQKGMVDRFEREKYSSKGRRGRSGDDDDTDSDSAEDSENEEALLEQLGKDY